MNKLLIILLAVCLVSVHAFVKRDTEQPTQKPDITQIIQKGFEDISKSAKEFFDPETIKKGFNDVVDNVNAAIEKIKQKPEEAKQ